MFTQVFEDSTGSVLYLNVCGVLQQYSCLEKSGQIYADQVF